MDTLLHETKSAKIRSGTRKAPLRLRLAIRGAVQGVGFRPYIYRLATEMGLHGWVNNSPQGVFVEVEGSRADLEGFLLRLPAEKPPRASIQSIEPVYLDPVGFSGFEIRASDDTGEKTALILPDIATCPDCLREVFDQGNRRYLYPFTNCTNCGPRFSIIESLPYDRPNTTMKRFEMCERCRAEYENPRDRRFHAQPNACPDCGPHVELWDRDGSVRAEHHGAVLAAAEAIRHGKIVAVKGLGGFLLMADARNEQAVTELRYRKHRDEKPLALMYPHVERIAAHCEASALEVQLLTGPESPIVLLKRRPGSAELAHSVAPHNPYLGVMLPYTPLHYLLMSELGFPVIATSGNLSDEPICTDEGDAVERLGEIADVFLVHDRPIARHVDDSVVRIMAGREMVVRRARGYAPLPVHLTTGAARTLAVGAHLKNSVALSVGKDVFVSQHIGDLETGEALEAFRRVIRDFRRLYAVEPEGVVCDLHPEYLSTKFALEAGLPVTKVQHHAAHVYACMAENELGGPVLGVSWDGTGYGPDGTVWGGEFLTVGPGGYERFAHLRTFTLPGGDRAVKEPRRSAVGLLFEQGGEDISRDSALAPLAACSAEELKNWQKMMQRGANAPRTSSAGRLFDGVASILGLRQVSRFEGQAAMDLEFAIGSKSTDEYHSFEVAPHDSAGSLVVDWGPMLAEIIRDSRAGLEPGDISVKFHNTLAEMIVAVARKAGHEAVCLSGGVFHNKYLTERTIERLRAEGFRPYWHQRIPPNDGGIALGQVVAASYIRATSAAGS